MKAILFFLFSAAILAGSLESCKAPVESKPPVVCDTCCDTCDTTHVDTNHVDTTHHTGPGDTTSHNFTWTEYSIPGENNITGTWVFGPRCILAVNEYVYRFDGSGWSVWPLNNSEGGVLDNLSGYRIFGFDTNDFWLIHRGIVTWCDGVTGHVIRLDQTGAWQYPADGPINAGWGSSSHDMFFVGDGGTILHYDGSSWMKYPKVTDQPLQSVWGSAHDDVWACGYDQSTNGSVLLHFDGVAWSHDSLGDVPTTSTGGCWAVWAGDSAGHKVVTTTGGFAYSRTDNGSWRKNTTLQPGQVALYTLAGNGPNDLLTAGGWGLVEHWNGRSWKRYDEFFAPGAVGYTSHALAFHGNTACVVGFKGGQSWILVGQR